MRIMEIARNWKLRDISFIKINRKLETKKIHFNEITDNICHVWKCILGYLNLQTIRKNIDKIKKGDFKKEHLPSIKFFNEIDTLLYKFKLSIIWENSIIMLLLTGLFFLPQDYCPIIIEKEKNKVKISIPILQETGLEDV